MDLTEEQKRKLRNMSPSELRKFKRDNDLDDDISITDIIMTGLAIKGGLDLLGDLFGDDSSSSSSSSSDDDDDDSNDDSFDGYDGGSFGGGGADGDW